MWIYEKKLQYPVKIKNPNPALAKLIISQYGGPHGEIGASLRYLSQRYAMPYPELRAILTDVGTEELAHLEMVGTIVYQLTRNLTPEQIKAQGFDTYFVDHTTGVYPVAASGTPFSAATFSVTGDTLADLNEDLAAEQKARGAETLFVPAGWVQGENKLLHWRTLLCARAIENGLTVLGADQYAPGKFVGHSMAFQPDGTALGELGGEQDLLIVKIN